MNIKINPKKIESEIINIIEHKQPATGTELLEIISKELNIDKKDAIEIMLILEDKEKIKFYNIDDSTQMSFNKYLFSRHSYWYLSTISLSIITILSIFIIPPKQINYLYIKYILGSIFIIFLPGYSLSKILYINSEINNIKLIALSLGISISLSSIIGLILNYTQWGIDLIPLVSIEFLLIIIFSTIGIMIEYNKKFS